jgi:hypothetical protein
MPGLTLRFDSAGRPLISVEVKPGLPLQQAFQTHPPNVVPSFTADFLVDTGATNCWIEEHLIAPWHLMKTIPILTQSGLMPVVSGYAYPLSLRLRETKQPDSWYHPAVPVGTVPPDHFNGVVPGMRGLIGMDVLQKGMLEYDGPGCTCRLSWP